MLSLLLVSPCAALVSPCVALPLGIATAPASCMIASTISQSRPPLAARGRPILMAAEPDAAERAAAAAPYLLPCLDGFFYGAYVYATIPLLGSAALGFLPVVNAFQSLPFAGLILFIGLSTFTRNPGLSRFVRFNIQQALLLDIVLLIPGILGQFGAKLSLPQELQALGSNTVFYAWVLVVLYSWSQIAFGKTPDQVPVLSEAASMQIGPM